MTLLATVRSLFGNPCRSTDTCRRERRPARHRLGLEPLEARTLLAAFVVDRLHCLSDQQDGSAEKPFCTIQRGIDAAAATAESDDTVQIQPAKYREQLDIATPVSLVGSTATVVKAPRSLESRPLDGGAYRPVIYVHDTSNVFLRRLVVDAKSSLASA